MAYHEYRDQLLLQMPKDCVVALQKMEAVRKKELDRIRAGTAWIENPLEAELAVDVAALEKSLSEAATKILSTSSLSE